MAKKAKKEVEYAVTEDGVEYVVGSDEPEVEVEPEVEDTRSLDDLLGEIGELNLTAVDTETPEGILSFQEQVARLQALTKALKKAGPKVKRAAKTKVTAELSEGDLQQLEALRSYLVSAEESFEETKLHIAELKRDIKAITGTSITSVERGPRGIGALAKNLILEGKTNEEIMAEVVAMYPTNATNINCINWYRNQLKHYPDTFGVKPKAAKQADMDSEGGDGEGDTVTVDTDAVHYSTENEDGTAYTA